jgi:hypothetical protein
MLPTPSFPPPPGRPRALDETKLREICALVSAGCGIIGAARYVGCAASTIRREARRNSEFNEKLRRANLAAELGPLNAVRDAAKRHWRAGVWLLERADAQRFGKKDPRNLTPDQMEAFVGSLIDIIGAEIKDVEVIRQINLRMNKQIKHIARELAAERDPFPKVRRQYRHGYRPTTPPIPNIESFPEFNSP